MEQPAAASSSYKNCKLSETREEDVWLQEKMLSGGLLDDDTRGPLAPHTVEEKKRSPRKKRRATHAADVDHVLSLVAALRSEVQAQENSYGECMQVTQSEVVSLMSQVEEIHSQLELRRREQAGINPDLQRAGNEALQKLSSFVEHAKIDFHAKRLQSNIKQLQKVLEFSTDTPLPSAVEAEKLAKAAAGCANTKRSLLKERNMQDTSVYYLREQDSVSDISNISSVSDPPEDPAPPEVNLDDMSLSQVREALLKEDGEATPTPPPPSPPPRKATPPAPKNESRVNTPPKKRKKKGFPDMVTQMKAALPKAVGPSEVSPLMSAVQAIEQKELREKRPDTPDDGLFGYPEEVFQEGQNLDEYLMQNNLGGLEDTSDEEEPPPEQNTTEPPLAAPQEERLATVGFGKFAQAEVEKVRRESKREIRRTSVRRESVRETLRRKESRSGSLRKKESIRGKLSRSNSRESKRQSLESASSFASPDGSLSDEAMFAPTIDIVAPPEEAKAVQKCPNCYLLELQIIKTKKKSILLSDKNKNLTLKAKCSSPTEPLLEEESSTDMGFKLKMLATKAVELQTMNEQLQDKLIDTEKLLEGATAKLDKLSQQEASLNRHIETLNRCAMEHHDGALQLKSQIRQRLMVKRR